MEKWGITPNFKGILIRKLAPCGELVEDCSQKLHYGLLYSWLFQLQKKCEATLFGITPPTLTMKPGVRVIPNKALMCKTLLITNESLGRR